MDGTFVMLLTAILVFVVAIIVRAVWYPSASSEETLLIIIVVTIVLLAAVTIVDMVAMSSALDDFDIENGPPTLEGVVEEYRITGGNDHYSGTLVVDGQRFDFTAEELPVFNVGYEYQIWMNEGRLLKYQEV